MKLDVNLVTTRNATFQQWQSLLANRTKRHRTGEFVVQGVRPITMAVRSGWPIRALLSDGRPQLSSWALELWESVPAARFVVAPELMAELGEKTDGSPELIAVAELPADSFSRLPAGPELLAMVFDRPASPGNIGTLIRSVDAFGGSGVVITGHAADPYDPQCVRATTGSFFTVPVVRAEGHREVLGWVGQLRGQGLPVTVIGTDEKAKAEIGDLDLAGPVVLVIGNETTGLAAGWRDACDLVARIPMTGAASSLNAATAGSVLLYEAMRQRRMSAGSR
jgi:tRNA G18 (ribose-2'-O)-methylase SpoU